MSHELIPPLFATQIRVLPHSVHRRTVCLRIELKGCQDDSEYIYNIHQSMSERAHALWYKPSCFSLGPMHFRIRSPSMRTCYTEALLLVMLLLRFYTFRTIQLYSKRHRISTTPLAIPNAPHSSSPYSDFTIQANIKYFSMCNRAENSLIINPTILTDLRILKIWKYLSEMFFIRRFL